MNGGKRTILLVDDDDVTLEIMKIYLESHYTVIAVSSGRLAIETLAKRPVDLILLDYMMPEMDGPSVFQHVRKNFTGSHVPIVFLTGVSDKDLVTKGLSLRPSDYLLKPVGKTDLLERVQQVLANA